MNLRFTCLERNFFQNFSDSAWDLATYINGAEESLRFLVDEHPATGKSCSDSGYKYTYNDRVFNFHKRIESLRDCLLFDKAEQALSLQVAKFPHLLGKSPP